jgi:hypothetical protein
MNNENRQLDNNTGIAFIKNSNNPAAPKLSGTINVEGKVFKIAIWERTSKAGNNYQYFKIEPQTSTSK